MMGFIYNFLQILFLLRIVTDAKGIKMPINLMQVFLLCQIEFTLQNVDPRRDGSPWREIAILFHQLI